MTFLDTVKKKFDLALVKDIDLDDMSIDFTLPDSWISTVASDRMTARLTSIPGFNWPIQQVRLKVTDEWTVDWRSCCYDHKLTY